MEVVALITASGQGSRLSSSENLLPKQFHAYRGIPLWVRSTLAYQNSPLVSRVLVAVPEQYVDLASQQSREYGLHKVHSIVSGGGTGQETIYRLLVEAKRTLGENCLVLIHDAVRPLIDDITIQRCCELALIHGSAVTASISRETPALLDDEGKLLKIIEPREQAATIQAPQAFFLTELLGYHVQALALDSKYFIDSCSLFMHFSGKKPAIVIGPSQNLKITDQNDAEIYNAILAWREQVN